MAITISNLRISPYTQKNSIKPVYGDTMTLTFALPEPFVEGDDYILALDYERVLVPTARPLCALATEYTIDGGDITFALEIRTARFRDWVSSIKKPMPVWLQIQRKRDGIYDTILLDDVLALPSVTDGDNTVFPGDPLEDLLDGKLDKPAKDGSTGDLLKRGADGKPVWAKGGGGSQVQANWDESDSSEPSYIKNKPEIPSPQEQSDWDESDSSDVAYIRHKPALDYIPSSEKGAPLGVAQLDENGKVPRGELPLAGVGANAAGAVKLNSNYGGIAWNGSEQTYLKIQRALNADIDGKANEVKPIVPKHLDYAVRSVLPNVTFIPATTTEYNLVDASATTNNHSWQYFHAPAEASTYTFPAVTDTTVAHRIKLTLDFTNVQTYSFEDSEGTAIVPLFTPTISAGDVYEFRCEYSAMQSRWLIWPVKQGAVGDDYVMQSQVGAANGVAPLNADGKLIADYIKLGTASSGITATGVSGEKVLSIISAADTNIRQRNTSSAITPYNLNRAVTAALTDANKIQLTDAQKASAQDTLGAAPAALHGSGAPTTSTVGVVGQLYMNTSTGQVFVCKSISNTGTEEEPVYSYNWEGLLYAWNSVPAQTSRIVQNTNAIQFYRNNVRRLELNTNGIRIGGSDNSGGIASMAIGNGVKTLNSDCLAVGWNSTVKVRYQTVLGQNNADASNCLFLVGNGTSASAKNNGLTSDISGNLYIYGGHQQAIHIIPSATTAYTLVEGCESHVPSSAPTYTLPTISDATRTHEVILTILFRGYYRSAADDSGSAYAWKATDGTLLYTDTTSITEGTTKAYSDVALTTEAGTIELYDGAKTAFALAASYSFEDAAGSTIVPLSTPTIEAGSVVTFLCRWEALLSQWVVMPIPLNPSYEDESSSSGGGGVGVLTATGGSMDFTGLNGTWTQAGSTTASGTDAPYYTIEYGGTTYYVSRAYSSFEGSVVWAITTYSLESEASDWPPNINEACMAYAASSAASPVGLTFTPTYNYEGNCPMFSA